MTFAISAQRLSKCYFIRHEQKERYVALRDVISNGSVNALRAVLGGVRGRALSRKAQPFWALNDLNFDVKPGDRVGIIGRNGAGKSTLLKVLSRVTEPTAGRVAILGRMASLLEVGTGFHPELTGRENIFLNGAILGMRKAEIKRHFHEIVAFADVDKFLDTPVKRYSSGMYVRLAFAVAAHLEAEILVVDEVLAVGDAEFQSKCLGRMDQVSQSGRTIIFVSHNLAAVQRLCNRGIYLDAGRIRMQGDIAGVLEAYQSSIDDGTESGNVAACVKEGDARFVEWCLRNPRTGLKYSCYSRDECRFDFKLVANREVENAFFGLALWDSDGKLIVAGSSMDHGGRYVHISHGAHYVSFSVRLPIKAGRYTLDISLNSSDLGQLERWSAHPKLIVLPNVQTNLSEHWHGLVNEDVRFEFGLAPLPVSTQESQNL
jgi:lipopolysaccharide transport system ATP-binding protein